MVKLLNPWVEPLKNGKFKYRARFKNPLTMKYQTVNVMINKNTPQAKRLALPKLPKKADAKAGEVKVANITLKDLVNKYQGFQRARNLPYNSIMSTHYCCKQIVKYFGENTLASQITVLMLNKYFNKLLETKAPAKSKKEFAYTNRTINNYASALNGVSQYGVDYGYLKK